MLQTITQTIQSRNKTWDHTVEKVLKDIENSCKEYKYMHVKGCKRSALKYDITIYIVIALAAISSILASTYDTISNCNSDNNKVIQIFLSLISGVLSAIIKFSKFEHKATVHRATSLKFASLENNIKRQLTLLPEDRQPADKYLEWVTHSFDELFNSSPIVVDKAQQAHEDRKDRQDHQDSKDHQGHEDRQDDPTITSPRPSTEVHSPESPRPISNIENIDYNIFSDGKMKYELARLRSN
jgi:hypothetical protein